MKLYRRFLASYLCVCLLPLAFSLVMVANMRQGIEESVRKEQDTTLSAAQNDLESCLVEASNSLEVLSGNDQLKNLGLTYFLGSRDVYNMSSILQMLEAVVQQRPSYIRCFAYLPRSGYLMTNESTYHPDQAQLSTWDLDVDYVQLLEGLEDSGLNASVHTLYPEDGGSGYLLVSKSCYDSRYRTLYASLGILIELDKEDSFLNTDTSQMFVLEEDGRLFSGGEVAQEVLPQIVQAQSSRGEVRQDGETWLYSLSSGGNFSNLRYGFLTLRNVYYSSLLPLLWQLVVLLFAAVVGVVLAVFLSRRTWTPMRQIIPVVEKTKGKQGGEYRSLAEFSQALTAFAQEQEQLLEKLSQSEERGNDLDLWRYLLGFTKDASCLSRYLEESQPYRLLALFPAQTETEPSESGEDTAASSKLYKILERVFLDNENGLCQTMGNMVVLLVQNLVELEDIREKVEQVQQETGQMLVCYVSDVCLRLSEAPEAWNWINRACNQDAFWQHPRDAGVWVARELLEYPGYAGGDFLAHRKQLFSALAAGKQDKVQKQLDVMLREDILNPELPVEVIRHRCDSVVEALLPYLQESDHKEAMKTVGASTLREMEQGLKTLFQKARLESQTEKAEEEGSQLVAQVRACIQENYQDPLLNVSLIANKLGRNLSTLSHQYKDLTGRGLLEDLHSVRLEAAKRLLKEGKTVRETAELSGYGDSRALIRAFKRYEGSTPGQFVDKK